MSSSRRAHAPVPLWDALERAREVAPRVDLTWLGALAAAEGWTLAPDALRFVVQLVAALQPRHVLEFGSGLSTRALARACGELPHACGITSIDHDPEFGPAAARALRATPPPAGVRVRFQVAPVVARDCGGTVLPVYAWRTAAFASRRAFDLVVIDGPPTVLGGRCGTLYQAMDFARAGTVLVLDDAGRACERAAAARWQDTLGPAIEVRHYADFARGLAVILVREPVPRERLWRHQEALCAADLERLIPVGAAYLQPEGDAWGLPMLSGRRRLSRLAHPPESDAQARAAVVAGAGEADFFVLPWSAFWWREQYPSLFACLRECHRCVVDTACLCVYDLRGGRSEGGR